jgi:hypothetical protein
MKPENVKACEDRLSLLKIMWTDYPAFISTCTMAVAWIIILAWVPAWRSDGPIVSPEAKPVFLSIAALITLVGMAILLWRFQILWAALVSGAQVRGKITKIEMRRDRGQVKYTYIFNHEEFQSSAPIHRNKQTLALKTGSPVILMVDKKRPSRAFIKDLYL